MNADISPGFGKTRVQLNEVLPLETPFTLNIVPSTICNFKCSYCVHSLDKLNFKERNFNPSLMDWETFILAIEQVKKFPQKLKVISLTGNGESMCNKNLPDMVKYIKKANITERIEFITNGSLLTGETTTKLIASGLDCIRISIQGLSSEKYKSVCGMEIDFNNFIKEIKFLYENKKNCKIFIKIIDIALEEHEEEKFYNLFGDICDRIFIEKVMPVFHGVDYSSMIKENQVMDRYGKIHKKRIVCPQSFFTLTVWPNGDIYPCDVLDDPISLGNINHISLEEVWNGDKRRKFLMMQLNKDRMKNSICNNCCAPDDVSQPDDDLDEHTEKLKERFK